MKLPEHVDIDNRTMVAVIRDAKCKYRDATGKNPAVVRISRNTYDKLVASLSGLVQNFAAGPRAIFGIRIVIEKRMNEIHEPMMGDETMGQIRMTKNFGHHAAGDIVKVDEIGKDHAFVTVGSGPKDVIEIPREYFEELATGGIYDPIESREAIFPLKHPFLEPAIQEAAESVTESIKKSLKNTSWGFDEANAAIMKMSQAGIPAAKILPLPLLAPEYLEKWPNPGHPDDPDEIKFVNDGDNVVDKYKEELEARIKGLTCRSQKKGHANKRLSDQNDLLAKTLKETQKSLEMAIEDMTDLKGRAIQAEEELDAAKKQIMELDQRLKEIRKQRDEIRKEREEIRKLNNYHVGEVNKGNEYRANLKTTIESLHDQLRTKQKTVEKEAARANDAERLLDRANRVIDYITKKPF